MLLMLYFFKSLMVLSIVLLMLSFL